jgi:hypothetical protein
MTVKKITTIGLEDAANERCDDAIDAVLMAYAQGDQMKMIERLKVAEGLADLGVDAATERRDDAIEAVLDSCIHNLSDAICNLRQSNMDWQRELGAWGILYDKRIAAEEALK